MRVATVTAGKSNVGSGGSDSASPAPDTTQSGTVTDGG